MNTESILRIEKLIDPAIDPMGAAEQTRQPWVSIWNGPWVVTGTSDIEEGKAFIRAFLSSGPSLGDATTMGSITIPDWTKD